MGALLCDTTLRLRWIARKEAGKNCREKANEADEKGGAVIRFNNDYNQGAHPAVLEAIARSNGESFSGYGTDDACREAAGLIRELTSAPDAAVHFLVGGTQTNCTLIGHALRPWESAISAACAHINVHETGAVERTGHKIETACDVQGKLTADALREIAEVYRDSGVQEHITKPRLAFISSPSEYGTIYRRSELEELRAVCDQFGMYLVADGARMAYGLGAATADVTLADFAELTDAFWIGGTKCGALFGEALVVSNPALDEGFRASIKQNGALLAKGWLLGVQFKALLEDGLYFALGRKADEQAMRVKEAFAAAGIPLLVDSPTNQQFAVLTEGEAAALEERFLFEPEGTTAQGGRIARFCTSWSTTDGEVDALVTAVAKLGRR